MGYYDDTPNTSRSAKKGNKAGYFFTGIIGVIVGALLVWLLLPSMVGVLPGGVTNKVVKSNTPTQQFSADIKTDVTTAVENVGAAVVGISNIQATTDFWNQSEKTKEAGSGSGVIYKKEGNKAYIVTNNHVVQGAKQLEVTLADGSKVEAKLVGADMWTDLAVIEMDSAKATTIATFGDSDALKVGETVIAIGNPLGLNFYGSVTTGVLSGKNRTVPVDFNNDGQVDWQAEVLQTDAAINPGNSGGALVNLAGQVIGINSMKIKEAAVEGLGFSIPINTALPVINELEAKGKVERPSMGVTLIDLTDVPAFHQRQTLRLPEDIKSGVVIGQVVKGSPADKAGAKDYDVIVELDGKKVENSIDIRKHLYNEKKVGDELTLKVYRGGQIVDLKLKLAESQQQ